MSIVFDLGSKKRQFEPQKTLILFGHPTTVICLLNCRLSFSKYACSMSTIYKLGKRDNLEIQLVVKRIPPLLLTPHRFLLDSVSQPFLFAVPFLGSGFSSTILLIKIRVGLRNWRIPWSFPVENPCFTCKVFFL